MEEKYLELINRITEENKELTNENRQLRTQLLDESHKHIKRLLTSVFSIIGIFIIFLMIYFYLAYNCNTSRSINVDNRAVSESASNIDK